MVIGDVGKTIQLRTGVDQSASISIAIFYCKPNGATGTWPATVNGDDNTIIEYTTVDGDIDQANGKALYWTLRSFIDGVYGGLVKPTVQSACGK